MLIAPAGYGKTHTITSCLQHTKGHQLILTHTHAGVISIKEKIKKSTSNLSKFSVETITSFAQKYVQGFYTKSDVPDQENGKQYYPFIISKATELFKLKPISAVISATYSGLFVDEYQDCTIQQHKLILALADLLPTHILGDPLQGIFNFSDDVLVDLNSAVQMAGFSDATYHLQEAWRWKGKNETLGSHLKEIRSKLESAQTIDLKNYRSITSIIAPAKDLYDPTKEPNRYIRKLLNEESLLLIHPDTSNIHGRIKLISTFSNAFFMVEAIDDKSFYNLAKRFDVANNNTIEKIIRDTCSELFNATAFNAWFNENGFKRKKGKEADSIVPLLETLEKIKTNMQFSDMAIILKQIHKLPGFRCYRTELMYSLQRALNEASVNSETVNESMVIKRNQIRRLGRKVFGRCIGTTLLTKGLEFDTVVILNAHKFDDPKHLYVALTRASKNLVVISEKSQLLDKTI